MRNFRLALEPAMRGDVDAVVHGGDLLFRSKTPPLLVQMALEPLLQVTGRGIPVYLVPGNHERSAIPYPVLSKQPGLFIFDRPRTYILEKNGFRLALAGFPYLREQIRERFPVILEETRWRESGAESCVLCMHHIAEGASLLTLRGKYIFRDNPDVIRFSDIPAGIMAVLSGHIHRFQVLTHDLRGGRGSAPVFYAGSVERTSLQEMQEEKSYLILEITRNAGNAVILGNWRVISLPTRPMMLRELSWRGGDAGNETTERIRRELEVLLESLPEDAVLTIRLAGEWPASIISAVFTPERLRRLAPEMNIELALEKRETAVIPAQK